MILPVRERARAVSDINGATARYVDAAGPDVASRFLDALQAAYIGRHPHIGSARYAHALNVPGLRHRKLHRYPWIVLYVPWPDRIEVIRVLDARRDIPATLMDEKLA